MTGFEIYHDAMRMLGYDDENAEIVPDRSEEKRAITAINSVFSDMDFNKRIIKLEENVTDSIKMKELMTYGVAMFLSFEDSDSHRNTIFTTLYNANRSLLKGNISRVRDVLPRPEGIA